MKKRIEDLNVRGFKPKEDNIISKNFKARIYYHPTHPYQAILLELDSTYPNSKDFLIDKEFISELGYEIIYPENRLGYIFRRKLDETFWGVYLMKEEPLKYFILLESLPDEKTF